MRFMIKSVTIILLVVLTETSYGQEKRLTVHAGADLVSSYVWRGVYQTGVSIQPTLSLSAYGVTLGGWGSTDFSSAAKALDFFLSYQIKGFTVGVTEYWWSGEGESYFKNRGSHYVEANLGYTVSEKFPLSIGLNTMLYGHGDRDLSGKQQYSTYFTAAYPFAVHSVDCGVGVGVASWAGLYSKNFNVATISARVSKSLQMTEKYALPIFVEAIFSAAQDNAYLIFGLKF